ncbi:MAG: hypothetical protein ACE5KS_03775, partial [Woeseiaceae bacterium]
GIAAVVVLALIIFLVRRKKPVSQERPAAERPASAAPSSEFHAVSIKFASSACSAAKALEGKRFLSGAAPRIPLPDCDVLECKCRFIHHEDRRDGEDRRDPFTPSIGDTGVHPQERRKQSERRKNSDT